MSYTRCEIIEKGRTIHRMITVTSLTYFINLGRDRKISIPTEFNFNQQYDCVKRGGDRCDVSLGTLIFMSFLPDERVSLSQGSS